MQITLTAEQEAIVSRSLELQRYRSPEAVVGAAIDWMRRCNEAYVEFNKTLDDAVEESDRLGWVEAEDVFEEADKIIAAAEQKVVEQV